jgi:hypothetical protein
MTTYNVLLINFMQIAIEALWFYITAQCSLCHFLPILLHCVILFSRIGALLCVFC